VELCASAT